MQRKQEGDSSGDEGITLSREATSQPPPFLNAKYTIGIDRLCYYIMEKALQSTAQLLCF